MKPSEILESAANIVLRDGWWQGMYYREPDGFDREASKEASRSAPCCQDGAISRAAIGYAWVDHYYLPYETRLANVGARRGARTYMNEYVRRVYHTGDGLRGTAITWNDEDGTTAEMVVEALRGAAADARQAGE